MTDLPFNNFKIPILLAVTGHRDVALEQYPEIRELLKEKIKEEVLRLYPDSPVKLLTPLADGADRLAADIALSLGISLIVPLPMPQHIYESTFLGNDGTSERVQSVAEFKRLLSLAEDVFTLPLVEGVNEYTLTVDSDAQEKQFSLVGAFLAKHSHILIAVYDGIDNKSAGGTSEVVKYRLSGDMASLPLEIPHKVCEKIDFVKPDNMFDIQHNGIVWHVLVARKVAKSGDAVKLDIHVPTGVRGKSSLAEEVRKYTAPLDTINNFNKDVESLFAGSCSQNPMFIAFDESLQKKEEDIVGSEKDNPGCLQGLRNAFFAADRMAVLYADEHKTYFFAFSILILFIASAEWLFAHESHDFEMLSVYLWIYFFCLARGFFIHRQHKKREIHNHYNEYRALAEALRVQFYWRCAGLNAIVPDHYLRKHQQETTWISCAVKALTLKCYSGDMQETEYVMEAWVRDQKVWFDGKRRSIIEANYHTKVLISVLYGLMFILSLSGAIWGIATKHHQAYLSAILGALPVIFFLLEHKMNYLADAERKRSYDIYHKLFKRAYDTYISAVLKKKPEEQMKEARNIIYQLGCEALIENGDWLIINRDKKVEEPK